ncbi:hypothetical protein IAQ61_009967, partial [Plenodomus lingam]|uniref:uncharacterized protein n=1 Tax=Leptosphaeria maculans TaxID=5022 RepID=UPI00332019EB
MLQAVAKLASFYVRVGFAKLLLMEYLVHIHAKKSLWTRIVTMLGAGGTGVSSSHVKKGGDSDNC